jgi:hypothetical protein
MFKLSSYSFFKFFFLKYASHGLKSVKIDGDG